DGDEELPDLWCELAVCRLLNGEPAQGWEACEHALAAAALRPPTERVRILARVVPQASGPEVPQHRPIIEETLSALNGEAVPEACELLAFLAYGDPTSRGDEAAA